MIGFGMSAGAHFPTVEHVQVVALYAPESGAILHLHTVTTLSGASPLNEDEAIAEAKALARRRYAKVEELSVALSNEAEHGRVPHRIDLTTKRFVPLAEKQ